MKVNPLYWSKDMIAKHPDAFESSTAVPRTEKKPHARLVNWWRVLQVSVPTAPILTLLGCLWSAAEPDERTSFVEAAALFAIVGFLLIVGCILLAGASVAWDSVKEKAEAFDRTRDRG